MITPKCQILHTILAIATIAKIVQTEHPPLTTQGVCSLPQGKSEHPKCKKPWERSEWIKGMQGEESKQKEGTLEVV